MKTHLSFSTSDLQRSVAFYRTLLGADPMKVLTDYALFVTEQPGLELALDAVSRVAPLQDVHFGVAVNSVADVDRVIARLNGAGLTSTVEREETCCYAKQTKVWAMDPEGRRWEVYTVHEETQERNDAETTCCS